MKFNWIVIFITLYFISVGLYAFAFHSKGWKDYFTGVNYALSTGLCYICIKAHYRGLSKREFSSIAFLLCYRSLCFLYLVIGDILGKRNLMLENISFIIFLAVSSFMAWFMGSRKYEKRKI